MQKKYTDIWKNDKNTFGPPSADILEQIPYDTEIEIVDVGSGNGRYAVYLANKSFKHITAIEIEHSGCEQIRKANNKIKIINVDILNFELFQHYDIVLSSGLIEEFQSQEEQIKCVYKLQEMTKSGGKLILRYCLYIANRIPENRVDENFVVSLFDSKWKIIQYYSDAKIIFNSKSEINDGENFIRRQTLIAEKL